jgi:N-acetylglucosamine-6-sulfatase
VKRAVVILMLMGSSVASAQKPDVVLIQTHDQPYHTLAFMPLTDSLMASGKRFSRFYANMSLGAPARATTLTGLLAHHHGIDTPFRAAIKFDDSQTLAVWLKAAGYRTALVGAYLDGYKDLFPDVPRGWDHWRAFEIPRYWKFRLSEDGRIVRYDSSATTYSTDVLMDLAVSFISSTSSAKPFFLYFTPYAIRQPIPGLEDAGSFRTLGRWDSPNYNEADVSDKPEWVRQLVRAKDGVMERQYESGAETLQSVDRAVLAIVQAAEARSRPLLLIFMPDNGVALGAHRWTKKHCLYEECSRLIMLVRGPAVASGTIDAPTSNVDLAPTLLDYAGASTAIAALDGQSLRPLLEDTATSWSDAVLVESRKMGAHPVNERFWAVRTGRYVYGEYDNGDRELYDLDSDPWQLNNEASNPAFADVGDSLAGLLGSLK